MQIDKTTLSDLCITSPIEEESIFHIYNHTQTSDGKFYLKQIIQSPLLSIEQIHDTQKTISYLSSINSSLPTSINNGTLMVIEKFFETAIDSYPSHVNVVNAWFYSVFNKADYNLSSYSLQHFATFVKGIHQIASTFNRTESSIIQLWKEKIEQLLNKKIIAELLNEKDVATVSHHKKIYYCQFLKYNFQHDCQQLIQIFCTIDAYLSIAKCQQQYQLQYPNFIDSNEPFIQAKGIFHLLLHNPVSYNIELNDEQNFLFLTGANMAGKSTFIKAVGTVVYLAHLGFPVPAHQLSLSYFDGLLSNINIIDNIFKNESYFFNEVKRIKTTIEKISNNKKWLILIDELFKGTNIQDAMKCSTTVIEGLQKKHNSLFILSTHLYEIANSLASYNNIQFKYFETAVRNNNLHFSYQLKNGVSNDKLGYLILEKEGVVDLLK